MSRSEGIDKRYQVFVSSTYLDLKPERQAVLNALLPLDFIPSGMELFPASNSDPLTYIKSVIDDCDYYVLVVAGRYGSTHESGKSFTELEYDYAISKKKHIIAFLHASPGSLAPDNQETAPERKERLAEFRSRLEKAKLCKYWSTADELKVSVSASLLQAVKKDPQEGWVRGRHAMNTAEIATLKERIRILESAVGEANMPPPGSEELERGDDKYRIRYRTKIPSPMDIDWMEDTWEDFSIEVTWDEIIRAVGPKLLDAAPEYEIANALENLITIKANLDKRSNVTVEEDDLGTIITHLLGLGILKLSDKKRTAKDHHKYWILTAYGRSEVTNLRAIRRQTKA